MPPERIQWIELGFLDNWGKRSNSAIEKPTTLSLRKGKIQHDLDCSMSVFAAKKSSIRRINLIFNNEPPKSFDAEGARIGGYLVFFADFIEGEVSLEGASIGGKIDCTGATIRTENLGNTQQIPAPEIQATAASIGGNVVFEDLSPEGPPLKIAGGLNFRDATIGGSLRWNPSLLQNDASLDLGHAKASKLLNRGTTLVKNHLVLNGFLFDRLDDDAPTDSASQLQWLRLQQSPGIVIQPYDTMIAALRSMGLPDQATDILIAENWDHGSGFYPPTSLAYLDFNRLLALLWYRVLGPSIDYGYRPANALWFFLFFLILGTRVFHTGYRKEVIVPTKPNADQILNYPKFHPFIYSLETFVPLLKLGMGENWSPSDASDKPIFTLPAACKKFTLYFLYGRFDAERRLAISPDSPSLRVRTYLWIHIICGWIVTTLLVAGLLGILKKS